jgi:methyl-accepting chemotaxis protein
MKWFLNLSAALKLILSSSILLAVTAIIGVHGLRMMDEMNHRLEVMYSHHFAGIVLTKTIEVAKMDAARSSRNAILKIGDNAAIAKEEQDLVNLMKVIRDNLDKAETIADTPETKAQLAMIRQVLPEYEQRTHQVFVAARTGDMKAAKAALEANGPVIKKFNQAVRLAASSQAEAAGQNMADNQQSFSKARGATLSLLAAALGLGIVLSLWLARIFSVPLKKTVDILNNVALGDFTKTLVLDSKDELGQMAAALNRAVAGIRHTLSEVASSANSVSAASQNLADATQKIAAGAHEQSASLDETSASLEQLTATVQSNSANAGQASEMAKTCSLGAEEGDRSVTAAIGAMSEINEASSKIASIVTTIDEMAFKTNLLAVNAAIEAARAGEHGRGFAVVSSEVRSLALTSAKSAHEINELVSNSFKKVENGSQLVNQSGTTLRETVVSIKHVTNAISEIATASREQLTGIQQVSSAMTQIDRAMQSNSLQTEEISKTAVILAEEAARLRQLLTQFTIAES